MIETKDLVEFTKGEAFKCQAWQWKKKEYYEEVVARLKELDKLKRLLKNRGKQ